MNVKKVGRFLWSVFSFAFLLIAMLLAAFLLIVPKTVDALPLTILTGSMEPAMPPGTLAVVQPTDPALLKVGDVVTYQWEPNNPDLVTHRIIDIAHSSNGGAVLTAKGDNNASIDPPVPSERVMGKVIYAVPYFGWVTHKINSEEGREYRRWVGYGLIGYGALSFLAGLLSSFRAWMTSRRTVRPDGAVALPMPQQSPWAPEQGTRRDLAA